VKAAPRIPGIVQSVIGEPGPADLPAVTLSWAQSLDGSISTSDRARTALSGPQSLVLTHRLRAIHSGILVGIGTVLADDPLLTVRLADGPSPQPVVLDTHLRLPCTARLLGRADLHPWIFHDREAPAGASRELARRGARLFPLDAGETGLPLVEVLRSLRSAGISSLMVEGGARVLQSFLSGGLARQAVITVSPVRIDGIRVFPHAEDPGRLPRFLEEVRESCGEDVVTWGRLGPPRG
jgi:riboflavin-specific deaminase-like protein